MNISYDWYKIFCCAAECKSITIAAEKLFISQPAVSQTIKQLEEALNCTLFLRTAKGVKLTAEGEVLYKHASRALPLFRTASAG
ncbi:MAG: LysR family transcriptional regulator [Oscillospiraceae bacterium]|nr:LysR family transcriptional regulator [Oscillospiraceae bacterium]